MCVSKASRGSKVGVRLSYRLSGRKYPVSLRLLGSANDPIRAHQHIRFNGHADLLGGAQVDEQLEFHWLLDWKIGGLPSFKDLSR